MEDDMADDAPPEPDAEATPVARAMRRFHGDMTRPHAGSWGLATLLPFLPVIGIAALVGLSPTPDPATYAAPPAAQVPQAVETVRDLALGQMEAIDPAQLQAMGPREILQTNSELQALHAATTPAPPAAPLDTAFARQGAELRFFLALAALLVAIVISMLAQRHVLRAHTAPFWARAQKNRFVGEQDLTRYVELPAATPRLRLGLWLVIGFAYGMLAIGWSDRVFPWLEPPSPTLDPATLGALEGGVILPLLLGCALIALIYGTVALSVYAIHITAMNYPAVSAVLKFAAVVEAVWEDRKEAKTGQTTAPAPAAKVTDGDPAVVQSMLDLIPEAWKAMTPRTGILPVESGMTPRQIVDIINTFVRPLVVILILSLVCLSLYLDTLEAGRSWPEEIAAAHDYWIVVLGALCSAVVAAVYLPALSRLSLYAEAADDLPKSGADPGWRIERGTEAEQGTRVIVKRSSPARSGYPKDLERYLGASREKMRILLHTRHFAGGFHILLKQDLGKQIQTVAGLLAPTAAGAILKLI
jgi:hypothetical protein